MDTHRQVASAVLCSIRDAIDADDQAALMKALAVPSPRVGNVQTPYSLEYDEEYDAGYILEVSVAPLLLVVVWRASMNGRAFGLIGTYCGQYPVSYTHLTLPTIYSV